MGMIFWVSWLLLVLLSDEVDRASRCYFSVEFDAEYLGMTGDLGLVVWESDRSRQVPGDIR